MRGPRRRTRVLRWAAGFAVSVSLLAAAGAALLTARLNNGPIQIDAIGQRIAASLDARAEGRYAFDLGPTFLARSTSGPALVIDDFRVRSGGQTIVEAPRAQVSIDPLALLIGDVRPRRLQISNIDINLSVLPDGAIAIAGGGRAAAIPVTPAPVPRPSAGDAPIPRAALLAQAGKALRTLFDLIGQPGSALGGIERVAVKSGRLIVDDKTADRQTVFEDLDLEFDKEGAGSDLVVSARGPNGPLVAEVHAYGLHGEQRTLNMSVKDVSLDEVVLASGVRRPAFDSDVKLAANARFALDPNGRVREATASFGLSPGYVRLEDPDHEPYFIDEMSGSAHWDPTTRRIVVDPTHLFAADTRLTFAGTVVPPSADEENWRVGLGLAEPGTLSPERPEERVLPITDLAIDAVVLPFSQKAVLTRGLLKGPDIDVLLSGTADWTDGLRLKFNGQAGQGPLRSLLRVWPSHVASAVRAWLIGHTHGGTVRAATMSADYDGHALLMMRYGRPPPNETLTMDFSIANGSVDALAGLAPLTNLEANVHVTGRTMRLDAKGGTLEVSNGRRVNLLEGQLDMPDNDGSEAVPAHLFIRASGPVEAAAEILSKDAIRPFAQLPVDPGTLRGKVEGKLAVDFEIGVGARANRTKVDAALNATDFSADRLVGKERLENATVAIVNDAAGFKANGNGRMFGAPITFELRRPANGPTVAVANLVFDDGARARAGYAVSGVTGPIAARVNATLAGESTKAQVELDLTRTHIENGLPGLAKPAGRPARLAFTLDGRGSSVLLDPLVFEGAGMSARGAVELSAEGGFQSARLYGARLSAGDEFRADIQKTSEGMKVAVRAVNLDVRPFLKLLTQPGKGGSGGGGDFDLDLKSPVVTGFGKQAMSNVDLRLVRRGSTIRQFSLNAGFGRRPVVASMSAGEGGAPQVNIVTPDAGALFAFTDLYGRMEGGALTAVMQMESGRVTGSMNVRNFVLKDEPALRRLVAEGVPQGSDKPQPKVDAAQVAFDRLQVVFTHANGRLDIRDGIMNGQVVGLTIEGSVDDGRDALNLSGTYVPAYGINNLFAKIPVVGVFLGGGWNEGLFAVNYRITGKPSAPVLSINPLSAVAPGFLRKIFGALDGTQQNTSFPAPQLPASPPPNPRRPVGRTPAADPTGQ